MITDAEKFEAKHRNRPAPFKCPVCQRRAGATFTFAAGLTPPEGWRAVQHAGRGWFVCSDECEKAAKP